MNMNIIHEIIGNTGSAEWRERLKTATVEYVDLDQWTAQKSRFVARAGSGAEYAVALNRHQRINDGDILLYNQAARRAVVVRLSLSDVMVIDMSALARKELNTVIHISVELGHAIGNQHWPAVVKGTMVYVPLTVDRKVMASVMNTHYIEDITFDFRPGKEVIPYLAPHEIRRLFGGAERELTGAEHHVHQHLEKV